MAKIAIIGGGVIGSSIAYFLALAGHAADVVVTGPPPVSADLQRSCGEVSSLAHVASPAASRRPER
jgi:glycine/D-amino acid oxidase-like deaminating enzyme